MMELDKNECICYKGFKINFNITNVLNVKLELNSLSSTKRAKFSWTISVLLIIRDSEVFFLALNCFMKIISYALCCLN